MVEIRLARPTDVIPVELLSGAITVNPDQLLVAVHENHVVGCLLLFDGGHGIMFVDNLRVLETAPIRTCAKLIEGVRQYAFSHGIGYVTTVTASPDVRALAYSRGAVIAEPRYSVIVPVE